MASRSRPSIPFNARRSALVRGLRVCPRLDRDRSVGHGSGISGSTGRGTCRREQGVCNEPGHVPAGGRLCCQGVANDPSVSGKRRKDSLARLSLPESRVRQVPRKHARFRTLARIVAS